MAIGQPHTHFETVDSTNRVAREAAADGAPDGTLFTAAEQTAGRGRQGRAWRTPAGQALAWSVVLRREIAIPGVLPLRIGLGTCAAVEALGAREVTLKWPNDVWMAGRKVAGILVEARPQDGWAVAGVGLNLAIPDDRFPAGLQGRATSIGGDITFKEAIAALNREVGRWLEQPHDEVLAAFARRDVLRGRPLGWEGGSGTAAGIDRSGRLLVETAGDEIVTLDAGEVHLQIDRPQ